MKESVENTPIPLEQPLASTMARRTFSIGLPKCKNAGERRFPITPEAAAMLMERGFIVKMENGAADSIHYTDNQYARCGVELSSRDEALRCDIVIHLDPLCPDDIRRLKRGALLLTLLALCRQTKESICELLKRNIIAVALDLVEDSKGNTPFADILAEIDGRAAIATAAALLADPIRGKGILLGGVAGIVPCEVTVIGSDIAACAAARSAFGAGAMVRMFDNDVYRLRQATRELGPGVIGSALHPRVLTNALRTADVVIFTDVAGGMTVNSDMVADMKRGVLIYDLTANCGKAFPSIPLVDLAIAQPSSPAEPTRACYINAGSAVPRTAAMALSNTLLTMLSDLMTCEGVTNALKLLPGFQKAAYTFLGKPVNRSIASIAGIRHVDISIYLTLS